MSASIYLPMSFGHLDLLDLAAVLLYFCRPRQWIGSTGRRRWYIQFFSVFKPNSRAVNYLTNQIHVKAFVQEALANGATMKELKFKFHPDRNPVAWSHLCYRFVDLMTSGSS